MWSHVCHMTLSPCFRLCFGCTQKTSWMPSPFMNSKHFKVTFHLLRIFQLWMKTSKFNKSKHGILLVFAKSCDGHALIMWQSCDSHVTVMWWSCFSHVTAPFAIVMAWSPDMSWFSTFCKPISSWGAILNMTLWSTRFVHRWLVKSVEAWWGVTWFI